MQDIKKFLLLQMQLQMQNINTLVLSQIGGALWGEV